MLGLRLTRMRSEDGAVTVPTVLWFPLFFGLLFWGLELFYISYNQVLLIRSVDVVTRDLRLGNDSNPTHDTLKTEMCDAMHFVSDCSKNLAIEVFPVDTSTWSLTNTNGVLCTDSTSTEELNPDIQTGGENEMMVIRACLKLPPFMQNDPLAQGLVKDASGRFALIATSVFVNEPNRD